MDVDDLWRIHVAMVPSNATIDTALERCLIPAVVALFLALRLPPRTQRTRTQHSPA